jgi:hypothetical protein
VATGDETESPLTWARNAGLSEKFSLRYEYAKTAGHEDRPFPGFTGIDRPFGRRLRP